MPRTLNDDRLETRGDVGGKPTEIIQGDALDARRSHSSATADEAAKTRATRLKPIHVLASSIHSSYVAHSLSVTPKLPPVSLIMSENAHKLWVQEGQRIQLLRGDSLHPSGTIDVEITPRTGPDNQNGHIDQLVVTSRAGRILKDLAPLVPRIDRRTVLCLIQDALGIPELLNERLFSDPAKRPMYVLGHMTLLPRFVHTPDGRDWYSFVVGEEQEPGGLYLTATLGDEMKHSLLKKHPPVHALVPQEHFLYAISTDRKLNVKKVPMGRFLQLKLPKMVFLAVVEPLVAMLDCEYGELCRLASGLDLADQMLTEISSVLASMPELNDVPNFCKHVKDGKLRADVRGKLYTLKETRASDLRALVKHGRDIDIDHTAGWFVKRGRELGINLPITWSVMQMVKAQAKLRRKRNDAMIRFEA